MATFGARYINFAPFSGEEPADALPTYGEAVNIGKLVKAELTVNMASGKIYGDDVLDESIDVFANGTIAVETTDMTLENESVLFGSTMTEDEGKELSDSSEDTIPYGGLTYIKTIMRGKKKLFRAHFYPKVKASHGTDSAATTGESITFTSTPINFTVFEANIGKWRYREEFATYAEAKTWCDGKFTASP